MIDYMYTDKTDFINVNDYKIVDNGIWLSRDELTRLMKYYDEWYTNIYNSNSPEPSKTSSLQKVDLHYKICRDLVKLIDRNKNTKEIIKQN